MNGSVTRPWTVTTGCAISITIFVWNFVSAGSDELLAEMGGLLALLLPLLLALGIVPMIFTIAAFFRRNWGRIGLVVIAALDVLAVPFVMHLEQEMVEPIDAETVLYAIAGVLAVVLLFMPASNEWYRNRFAAEPVRP
jgi:hypothetical protein